MSSSLFPMHDPEYRRIYAEEAAKVDAEEAAAAAAEEETE